MPIMNESLVSFTRSDGTTDSMNFVADSLYCRDNSNGGVGSTTPSMSVSILFPYDQSEADQLHQMITWKVDYTGTDEYSQTISIQSENETEWVDHLTAFTTTCGTWSGYLPATIPYIYT
jgi:hypothetical protein